MFQKTQDGLDFSPKLLHLPVHPLMLPFSRKVSWTISHFIYFPGLCVACILSLGYGRPLALVLKPRGQGAPYVCSRDVNNAGEAVCQPEEREGEHNRRYVEISGYSFVGWGVISVDDEMVIKHEFSHVENWLGRYNPNKLVFNVVPLMVLGIFVAPLIGLGPLSLALSLALVLTFSLMAFVKLFH